MSTLMSYPLYKGTGSDWLDSIPEHWGVGRISHLATRITDGAHISPETNAGVYPFVSTKDVSESGINFDDALKTSLQTYEYMVRTGCQPKQGDVLFSKDGTIGRTVIVYNAPPFVVASSLIIIRPDLSRVDSRYLSFLCRSVAVQEQVRSFAKGAGLPRLSISNLLRVVVPVPPLAEQREIANYLDREIAQIDAFIDDQKSLIDLLIERKRSIVEEWTSTSTETTSVPLRFLYKQSKECNHPQSEVLSVYRDYGVIPKSSRDDNYNKTPDNLLRYLVVKPGYLVINKMKAWQGSLGVSAYEGIVSPDYEVLAPISRGLHDPYIHHVLRSPRLVSQYAIRSVGIRPSQWRLYWEELGKIAIPVPSVAYQIRIADRVDRELAQTDLAIADADEAIELSRERRAALISAAVTGKIDVRIWKESAERALQSHGVA